MAVIPQKTLFRHMRIEELGDLSGLVPAIGDIPDKALMTTLGNERGHGRDDYPVRPMWNPMPAGVIFRHPTNASPIGELKRNGQLRAVCGFNGKMPGKHNYGRFLKPLLLHQDEIDDMSNLTVEKPKDILPDLGETPAGYGKAMEPFAKGPTKRSAADGRSEMMRTRRKDLMRSLARCG
jgi:hypothetical protein